MKHKILVTLLTISLVFSYCGLGFAENEELNVDSQVENQELIVEDNQFEEVKEEEVVEEVVEEPQAEEIIIEEPQIEEEYIPEVEDDYDYLQ